MGNMVDISNVTLEQREERDAMAMAADEGRLGYYLWEAEEFMNERIKALIGETITGDTTE